MLEQRRLRVRKRRRLPGFGQSGEEDRGERKEEVVLRHGFPKPVGGRGEALAAAGGDHLGAAFEDDVGPVARIALAAGRREHGNDRDEGDGPYRNGRVQPPRQRGDRRPDHGRPERQGEDEMPRLEPRDASRAQEHEENRRCEQSEQAEGGEGCPRPQEDNRAHDREHEKERKGQAISPGEGLERAGELRPGVARARQRLVAHDADAEPVGETQVGGRERKQQRSDREHGQGGLERPPAPDRESHDRLGPDDDHAVRMHGRQQERGERSDEGGAGGPKLERAGEQVGRERAHESEERVHAAHRPVEGKDGRGRGDERRGRSGHGPCQTPPEVEAERNRGDGEDDREPAQSLRRGVDRERDVRQQEVERRAAPIPQHGREKLAERTRGDQPGDRLVLEERLPADVGDEPKEKNGGRRRQRAGDEQSGVPAGPGPRRRIRLGRPARGALVRVARADVTGPDLHGVLGYSRRDAHPRLRSRARSRGGRPRRRRRSCPPGVRRPRARGVADAVEGLRTRPAGR